ncbi:hypothetical protein M413DRAFT_443381 [Hebeloma cylindrosporum]|uniref:Uncharacterized protein n=1 Tax=Hebeloma cylindrosporum TaxID=76867 RepID=A0A0C3CH07_HEBCY|nr:hypothetical protein M413DRAFT_443381 [Hebeloma cylindrosporum h7]
MKSNHKKRKYRPPTRHDSHPLAHSQAPVFLGHHDAFFQSETTRDKSSERDPLSALYIQAHEADVVHGSAAATAAQSLEVVEYQTSPSGVDVIRKIGSALIRWGDGAGASRSPLTDIDDESVHPRRKDAESEVWVDRYVQ